MDLRLHNHGNTQRSQGNERPPAEANTRWGETVVGLPQVGDAPRATPNLYCRVVEMSAGKMRPYELG
eukprot:6172559-Prymnesium_polylepis.1